MDCSQITFSAKAASDTIESALREYFDYKPASAFTDQDRERVSRLMNIAMDYLNRIIENCEE